MTVEKSDDKSYPYTIKDGWGDKVYCSLEDLKDIKKQINRILKEEKGLTKQIIMILKKGENKNGVFKR